MQLPTDIYTYGVWSGYTAIGLFFITIIAFIAGWGFRFRLFGVTSFMMVLTAGIFALHLGLFQHVEIPGSARYVVTYDNGANKAVVKVNPDIDAEAIEPTLRQAASDLYSYGRTGTNGNDTFDISLRTVLHPDPETSELLFLGEAKRSLLVRDESNLQIQVFSKNVAKLARTS